MSISAPIFACADDTYAMPMPQFKLGESVPLVTSPMRSPRVHSCNLKPFDTSEVNASSHLREERPMKVPASQVPEEMNWADYWDSLSNEYFALRASADPDEPV